MVSVLFLLSLSSLKAAAFLPKSKSDMARHKVLGRMHKDGTGRNSRERAQVSQHQRRVKKEASPPLPATVVACPVMAETPARPTSKIRTPQLVLSHNKSTHNFASIPSERDSNGKAERLNVTELTRWPSTANSVNTFNLACRQNGQSWCCQGTIQLLHYLAGCLSLPRETKRQGWLILRCVT